MKTLQDRFAGLSVSFDFRADETAALVGESGCGKTTIGKAAVVQLLRQQAAISGQALLDGAKLLDLDEHESLADGASASPSPARWP